jgi:hypothetical protein
MIVAAVCKKSPIIFAEIDHAGTVCTFANRVEKPVYRLRNLCLHVAREGTYPGGVRFVVKSQAVLQEGVVFWALKITRNRDSGQ